MDVKTRILTAPDEGGGGGGGTNKVPGSVSTSEADLAESSNESEIKTVKVPGSVTISEDGA